MIEPFELFIGYLGNGATVCNKASIFDDDYQIISHISEAGIIKWFVPSNTIPAKALEAIEKTAIEHREKTIKRLDSVMKSNYGYTKILEEIFKYSPWDETNALCDSIKSQPKECKNELIKEFYLKWF